MQANMNNGNNEPVLSRKSLRRGRIMKSKLMRLCRVQSVSDLSPPDRDTLLEPRAEWKHLFDEYGRVYLSYASTLKQSTDMINVRMSHEKEKKCYQ